MPSPGQKIVNAATLYAVESLFAIDDMTRPGIEVINGTINVWGAQWQPASPPAGMSNANAASGPFSGIDYFSSVPQFLYFETVSGTPIITLIGMKATAVV